MADRVADCLRRCTEGLEYGVVVAGGTPFWEWSGGRGLRHHWTSHVSSTIENLLMTQPVYVVFFEKTYPGRDHVVWMALQLKAVVWTKGHWAARAPNGWQAYTEVFTHQDLGGVTTGKFLVHMALRTGTTYGPPPEPVGVAAKLGQVLDPMVVGGKRAMEVSPSEAYNMAGGLLLWKQWHGLVMAPTVYAAWPYVQRRLEDKELLLVLEVPGTRIKGVDADTLQGWRTELSLPFKVRHAVNDWV